MTPEDKQALLDVARQAEAEKSANAGCGALGTLMLICAGSAWYFWGTPLGRYSAWAAGGFFLLCIVAVIQSAKLKNKRFDGN